ncbi:MAG: LuxR C-terminal-related transcriptional regulator, partial [Acidimicrobiia bacterium]|nr:LuxR C-terminal-related transcriptional regulator [Acidimicrobiia bacterium]
DIDDGEVPAFHDPLQSLIPAVINSFHGRNSAIVLVLDDYHVITDAQIHRAVDYLIENQPSCLQVAIATRSDPPLALPRLRAAGSLVEVRAADLGLSVDDTEQLLRERFGLTIEREQAAMLCERTEGWPAGIQLAGLSLASDPDPIGFITSFAGDDRNVADYLTSEVLRRQPENRKGFLLATSIVDEFTAELCDHLLEMAGSSIVLEELEHENLFLVPLDTRRRWFRYHHLFRDWLRHNHRVSAGPDEIRRLHRRAADWLQEHNLAERAIGHLVAAGDTASAAATMELLLRRLPFINHVPVRTLLTALPDDIASTHPAICMARVSHSVAIGDAAGAASSVRLLDEALTAIDDPDEIEKLCSQARVYRALQSLIADDATGAERQLRAVLDEADPIWSAPAAYAQGLLGMALLWTSGAEAALHHLRDGALARRRLLLPDGGVTAHLAAAHADLGQWERAEEVACEAFALPIPSGSTYPSTVAAHYAMAQVHHHRGRHAQARAEAQAGLDLARSWIQPGLVSWGCVVLAGVEGNRHRQRQLLAEARKLLGHSYRSCRVGREISAAERELATPCAVERKNPMADPLTRRELEVLQLFRGDLSLRAIAGELYISHNTAKGHAKAIYQKLGVNSRGEAVSVAAETGLIRR